MSPGPILGGLSRLHELLIRLVESLPDDQINRRLHPDLPAIGWLLGRVWEWCNNPFAP